MILEVWILHLQELPCVPFGGNLKENLAALQSRTLVSESVVSFTLHSLHAQL